MRGSFVVLCLCSLWKHYYGWVSLPASRTSGTDGPLCVRSRRDLTRMAVKKSKRLRIDDLLIVNGMATDRKTAAALVLAGDVFIRQDERVVSPAYLVSSETAVRLRERKTHQWASRGGLKLEHAINTFLLMNVVRDCIAIDVGCSTGGFTDVLLHGNASRVYAVDVGYGLLDYRLRQDPRVSLLERTNARFLNSTLIPDAGAIDLVVCDASFISLESVLPAALDMVKPGGHLVALVKPQFQADVADVAAGGLVDDPQVHERVCARSRTWLETLPGGWKCIGIVESPIRGLEAGNKEFLMYGIKSS